jgi:hypothetical protein
LNIAIAELYVKRIQILKFIKSGPKKVGEEIEKRLMTINSNHAGLHEMAGC